MTTTWPQMCARTWCLAVVTVWRTLAARTRQTLDLNTGAAMSIFTDADTGKPVR